VWQQIPKIHRNKNTHIRGLSLLHKTEKKWRVIVAMKKTWDNTWGPKSLDGWDHKPTTDDILECFALEIQDKHVPDDTFLIIVKEVPASTTPNQT
jgi:hypothetical protein